MTRSRQQLTRRVLLAGALGTAALSACSATPTTTARPSAAGGSSVPSETTSSGSATATPSVTAPSVGSSLPAAQPWRPGPGEVDPAVKLRATTLVEAAGTWTADDGQAGARRRLAAYGFPADLLPGLAHLLAPAPQAVVRVRDAQYGGFLGSSASVLVVVDQWRLADDGSLQAGGTTLDVRLVQASPHWRVTAVLPADPGPATASPSGAAREVLAAERVRLPYAARSDVLSGRVHDSVLALLLALAGRHVVDVSVVRSGHPVHVFGTSRTSDHSRGRAVDVWALDGRPLVRPENHALASSAQRFAVEHGAYNVGGPVLLPGPEYFSDRTHQDHIHLGLPS